MKTAQTNKQAEFLEMFSVILLKYLRFLAAMFSWSARNFCLFLKEENENRKMLMQVPRIAEEKAHESLFINLQQKFWKIGFNHTQVILIHFCFKNVHFYMYRTCMSKNVSEMTLRKIKRFPSRTKITKIRWKLALIWGNHILRRCSERKAMKCIWCFNSQTYDFYWL